jgi:putative membrane protein
MEDSKMKAILAASLILLTATVSGAADKNANVKGSPADATVSANVMAANDAEIMAGKLAEAKATNKDVKSFAQHMVSEHTKNDEQVASVSQKIDVTPKPDDKVASMKEDAKQKIDALAQKSGAEFDKAYMDLQVAMHEQVLADINGKLLPTAQNKEMKTFLTKTKGHVEQHLAMAKKIQSTLK